MCDAKAQLRELVIRVRALILSVSYELHFTGPIWEVSEPDKSRLAEARLRRTCCVQADMKGTPEVLEKTDPSKWILFQSDRMVRGVGIEPNILRILTIVP